MVSTKTGFWFTLSIFGWIWGPPSESSQGKEAFDQGEFGKAATHYSLAVEEYEGNAPYLFYNLGLCYTALDSQSAARDFFSRVDRQGFEDVTSHALNNLGVLEARNKKLKEALAQFQEALRKDPKNETARYNYELIKHMLENQPPPPDQPPPDSTPQPPPPKPKPREGSGDPNSPESIPLDSARKQLEALKQKEKTYIQELKKKVKGPARPPGSADW